MTVAGRSTRNKFSVETGVATCPRPISATLIFRPVHVHWFARLSRPDREPAHGTHTRTRERACRAIQIDLLLTCKPMYRGPRGTTAPGAPNLLRGWLICRREGTWDPRPVPRCAISGLEQRGTLVFGNLSIIICIIYIYIYINTYNIFVI